MPQAICVNCRTEMRCAKNDQLVNDTGVPVTYWSGDQYRCPVCGHEIVTRFGRPFTEPQVPLESIEFKENVSMPGREQAALLAAAPELFECCLVALAMLDRKVADSDLRAKIQKTIEPLLTRPKE